MSQGQLQINEVKKKTSMSGREMGSVMYSHITEQIRQQLLSSEARFQKKMAQEETNGHLYYGFSKDKEETRM